jgi:hypothetical protein
MKLIYGLIYPKRNYKKQAELFKARYGYSLPSDYIRFLEEQGAGDSPNPCVFEGICEIENIFNLSLEHNEDFKGMNSAAGRYEWYVAEGWISKNLLPIASASGGHTIFCLILSGLLRGHILRRQNENIILPEEYDKNVFDLPNRRIAIATSIDDFVSKLEPLEE